MHPRLSLSAEEQIVPFCGSRNDSSLTNSIKAGQELLHVLEKQDVHIHEAITLNC
jgi:hypothetical protein